MIDGGATCVHAAFAASAARWPARDLLDVLPETAGIYGIDPGPVSYRAAGERVERRPPDPGGIRGRASGDGAA